MAHVSQPRLLAMHGLRLKGVAEPDVVAGLMGLDEATVRAELGVLVTAGLVTRRDGPASGLVLTAAGRAENEKLLAEELEAAGARAVVSGADQRFGELNSTLLEICTAWQVRDDGDEPVANDHRDEAYDQEVIGRLVALHDRVRPVCAELREALERFGRYSGALRGALERVADGEHEYLTTPLLPSYHTVWFELHEDLLATLGIDRASGGGG